MRRLAITIVIAALAPGHAHGQRVPFTFDEPTGPPPYTHDGLAVRLALGGAYGVSWTRTDRDGRLTLDGPGLGLDLFVGWALTPRVVLGVQCAAQGTRWLRATRGGVSLPADGQQLGVLGIGLAATWYGLPREAYVTAAVGMTELTLSEDGEAVARTDDGPALTLAVGKEWWLSRSIAAGGLLRALVGRSPEHDGSTTWTTAGVSVLASASWN